MSSQVATPLPGGLPDHPSPPPPLHDFQDSAWSSHLNLDRHNSNPDTSFALDAHARETSSARRTFSTSQLDASQQRQAVGNLLAALKPTNSTVPAAANNIPVTINNESLSQTAAPATAQSIARSSPSVSSIRASASPYTNLDDAPYGIEQPLFDPLPPLPSQSVLPEAHFASPGAAMTHANLQRVISNTSLPSQISPSLLPQPAIPDRREVEAFAKLDFEDGNYYITTWACELGRDAFAYRNALARETEAKDNPQQPPGSSSGKHSRPSERQRRPADSQVQGSVISEAGGFAGVDEDRFSKDGEEKAAGDAHSSQVSAGDVVKPGDVLLNPPIPFDYHKNAELQAQMDPENEKPAPVTADHLPNADSCPLIPIHATTNSTKSEVATHKGISRRHVRIEWAWDQECFVMKVLGRNGAFLDGHYLSHGMTKKLSNGSKIQISDVQMTFRLPRPKTEPLSDDSDREEDPNSASNRRSTSPTSEDDTPSKSGKHRTMIRLTGLNKGDDDGMEAAQIGPDGELLPPKRRGPGRPPKDGVMSTRERKEREKAKKIADAKAANGGKTPPLSAKGKPSRPSVSEEPPKLELKPVKRKYKKRERQGDEPDVLPSIEGGETEIASDTEKPPVKKARASKSPSPEYPPLATLTEEQLARPTEPYARLIYDILAEIYPKALPLKQIYRALKSKFPFFVYRVDSDGWQSSVRHNLNQEWNKLFEKGEKEGKGFAWRAIPGALQPPAERKQNAARATAAAKPKPQAAPRNQPQPQGPTPSLHWQNSTPFPQNGMQRGPPPPYWPQGHPGPFPPPQPNGLPWPHPPPISLPPLPASPAPNGQPQSKGPSGQPISTFSAQQPPTPSGNVPNAQTGPPRPPSTNTLQNTVAGPSQPRPLSTPQPPVQSQQLAPPPPPPPPPPTFGSSSAAPNMPCTLDGLMAIKRFEAAMYAQVKDNTTPGLAYWQAIFASVRNRMLHGAPESSMPDDESREERTIMEHVRSFIEKFKNPAFVGFSNTNTSISRTVSPMASDAVKPSNNEDSAATPSDKSAIPKDASGIGPETPSEVRTDANGKDKA